MNRIIKWIDVLLLFIRRSDMTIKYFKRVLMVAVLSSIALTAFAEDAPVFDADNYPPQFDEQADASAKSTAQSSSAETQAANADDQSAPSQSTYQAALTPEQRVAKLEQQINNLQHSDSATKMGVLQTEVQSLRGEVENLTHQLQQMQTQQRTMYSDLDKRIAKQPQGDSLQASVSPEVSETIATAKPIVKPRTAAAKPRVTTPPALVPTVPDGVIPAAAAAPATVVADKGTSQPNVAEEQQIYQTAYDLIKAKKYNEAATTLQNMLKKYPSGQFAANAHYWLGELYGLMGKNDQAVLEFNNVVKNYPDSPKLADAQLKLGLLFAAQFKWTDAKTSFKKVINHYPGTSSAHLAAEQLKQIKQAGH